MIFSCLEINVFGQRVRVTVLVLSRGYVVSLQTCLKPLTLNETGFLTLT